MVATLQKFYMNLEIPMKLEAPINPNYAATIVRVRNKVDSKGWTISWRCHCWDIRPS